MAIKDGDKAPQSTVGASNPTVYPAGSDGAIHGASATDKIAFHGATPAVQRSGSAQAAVVTTAPTNTTPYGYSTSAQAAAIVTLLNEIRAALVEKGIIKGS
jgi:hypothetical protein